MSLLPGQIYWADLDPSGRRPVIVVSSEILNRGTSVVIVPCTSTNLAVRKRLPNCAFFPAGAFGLPKDTVAQGEMIATIPIDTLQRDLGPVGQLDDAALRDLIRAVGHAIGVRV